MKVFPALFDTEKNRKTGARPYWQLSLTCGGVLRVFSDIAAGGALAMVASWGTIQQGISDLLGEYKISDFSVDLLIDATLEAAIVSDAGEGSAVELKLAGPGKSEGGQAASLAKG